MLRHVVFLLVLLLAVPSELLAKGGDDLAGRRTATNAPLLVFYGPPERARAVAQGLADVGRRDGGAFIDLSPVALSAPRAPGELRRAVAAYQEFDYGQAMRHLSAALDEISEGGVRGLSRSDLSDLFIYRALVRGAQGNSSEAWNDFVQAALVDSTRHLDAVRFSPSVAASFERARTAVSESRAFSVSVQVSVNRRCQVAIDATLGGANPSFSLRGGRHFVRVSCEGYRIYSESLVVDGDIRLAPELEKIALPKIAQVTKLALDRGFRHVVFAQVALAQPVRTALFTLYSVDGAQLARTSIALAGSIRDRGTTVAAVSLLLDALEPKALAPQHAVAPSPWFRSPWLWGSVGVAIASAALLPFALRSQPSAGFQIKLGGATR